MEFCFNFQMFIFVCGCVLRKGFLKVLKLCSQQLTLQKNFLSCSCNILHLCGIICSTYSIFETLSLQLLRGPQIKNKVWDIWREKKKTFHD